MTVSFAPYPEVSLPVRWRSFGSSRNFTSPTRKIVWQANSENVCVVGQTKVAVAYMYTCSGILLGLKPVRNICSGNYSRYQVLF